jgi:acetyl/propionyl-CoA carboxylase alpha subunit
MFTSVLVANRGEIAVRIVRTLRRMGIRAVVLASLPDRRGQAARMGDVVAGVDGYTAAETYLDIEAVMAAAKSHGCDAIHPGYGFLSERADFAERCAAEGIAFVGPPASVLRGLGDKGAARRLAVAHGVPVVPGWDGDDDEATLRREAGRIGYPVMLKARGGGGGRGMREVHSPEDLAEAIESARREADAAFGDTGLLIEKLVRDAHHVEVQVLADAHGNVVHLGERDCSVQRRHQKLIEESPSPVVDTVLRDELTGAALRLARAAGYVNAGTFEFLVTGREPREWYFLEVNPRLQVEHPVTEEVTGLDLVELQLRVAAGESLPLRQEDVRFEGHAIEVRVNAEDPWDGFRGSGGRIRAWHSWGDSRLDAGYATGDTVSGSYDSLLAKLVGRAGDRVEAIERTVEDLGHFEVEGVLTNVAFARRILEHPDFRGGTATVDWLERELDGLLASRTPARHWAVAAAALTPEELWPLQAWSGARWIGAGAGVCWLSSGRERRRVEVRLAERGFVVTVEGEAMDVELVERDVDGGLWRFGDGTRIRAWISPWTEPASVELHDEAGVPIGRINANHPPEMPRRVHTAAEGAMAVAAPLAGTVAAVRVVVGDQVEAGQLLMTLTAMKMEHRIVAPESGAVREILARTGDVVREGDVLVELE